MDANTIKIRNLENEDEQIKVQVADILFSSFEQLAPEAWPSLRVAREEVDESFEPGRISLVALDGATAVGWISAIRQYGGHTWELHPLAVHKSHRGRGIGKKLVRELERRIAETGALTLWLGTDDELGATSLFGQELYPDPIGKLKTIRSTLGHPFAFYLKIGFVLCGILPDANGFGKPDIFMAKRVRKID